MGTNEDFLMEKLKISLASMEAEAIHCLSVTKEMQDKGMYESALIMLAKEEAFRACISMIKEDLGLE